MNVSNVVRQAIVGGGLMGLVLALAAATAWGDALAWANTTQSGAFFTNTNWTPVKVPANGDSLTLGTGTYTATGSGTFNAYDLTVGIGAGLAWQSGQLQFDYAGTHSNAGTISFNTNPSTWYMWSPANSSPIKTVFNSGLIEADGIALSLSTRRTSVDNTGGIFRAVNGGTISLNTSGGFSLLGGTFSTDDESSIINSGVNRNQPLNGVAVINAGNLTFAQTETSGTDGNTQVTGFALTNNASFANSGTFSVSNSSTGARKADTRLSLDATSTFANTGTITIQNTGTSNTLHKAYITSARSLTNEGTITVTRSDSAGPTYFAVTGAGNSFTQTGASSAVNLVNGGALTAATVAILEGALTGVGTITGNSTIGANATVAPGASIGTLTFVGNLTLQGTYDAEVDSVLGTADLLAVSGTLNLDGAVLDISLLDIERGTHSFLLATATGGITGSFASVVGPYGPTYEIDGNNLYLLMTIPEPTSLALLGLGGLAVLRRRRGV